MMIDETTLGGELAYLRDGASVSLSAGRTGTSARVRKGEVVEIRAVDVYLEVDDTLELFARRPEPLLRFTLRKEMFPHLFLDPHSHRVHQISGDEDLRRSESSNMTLMEVEGIPTLVSPGNQAGCSWLSARYPLAGSMQLGSLAWSLAVSRGTPQAAFDYTLLLRYWEDGDEDLADASVRTLTVTKDGNTPGHLRHMTPDSALEIVGYQVLFTASVRHDSQLLERHGTVAGAQSLGTPLLQSFYLIEKTRPVYDIHSLQELATHSSSYQLLEPALPYRRMIARVHLPATLTEGESLSVSVGDGVDRCEVRIDAALRTRPIEPRPRP